MKLSELVPSGAHTYSRSNDCFPDNAPEYLVKGNGCHVWDNNGKKYTDWGMSLRSVILGYCYPAVDNAVKNAIDNGIGFTRPSMYEMELAELMHDLIPCCEMVKFGKNGSDATHAAVKISRAFTGRDIVLIAKENPFISTADFFIETTALNDGCFVSGKTLQYSYNDMDFDKFDLDKVACIILDVSTVDGTKEKLQYIREICDKHGIIFVMDEVISGFRYDLRGVQGLYGVTPDLATFGKGMANGYSISALCGKKNIMRLGDREYGNVFLLSGTYFSETTGYSAALATINELQTVKYNNYGNYLSVNDRLNQIGRFLKYGIDGLINKYGLQEHIKIKVHGKKEYDGANPSMSFSSMELKTLFDQVMTECGVLMPYIAPCLSHSDNDIEHTINSAENALSVCRQALDKENVKELLISGHCEKPVFRRKE